MTDPVPPSVRERRLARELREARVGAQLTGDRAARELGWSASKVSRIETGRIGVNAADLDRLLALYAVPERHAEFLRRLAPAARARGWWDAYAESLSPGYAGLLRLEAGSRALRTYCAVVPHALLMTPHYIRRVITATWQVPPPAEVERRVRVCLRRQAVLGDGRTGADAALAFTAVLDEAVLRRALGPADDPIAEPARVEQLRHLMTVSRWPAVSLRVLPFSAGIPPVSAGSFSLLESRATGAPDVVYLENKTRISFVDGEKEVDRYVRDVGMLLSMALSEDDSVGFLDEIASGRR
ncbi:helix-turn-helix domain-containing protein [Nakamurella deserti]|uniref:helix-turn-helix domain-containing protein n=1 Tax=Nakamurella deserti TaxID=2164074 RepID=UPI000DBE605F|nr:helix-turn-helix transcriptional regulator [Nakamurella deserti]